MTAPAITLVRPSFGLPSRYAPLQPGGAKIAGPLEAPNTVNLPARYFPPDQAITFTLQANQAIVGAGQLFLPAGLVQQIPANCYGVVNAVELLLNGITLTSQVLWSILVDNSPVPGFSNMTILGRDGAASIARDVGAGVPLGLLVPLGGTVSVMIQDVDGGAYTAGTSLFGYYWPQQR